MTAERDRTGMPRRGRGRGRGRNGGRGARLPLALLRATPWAPLRAGLIALGVGAALAVEVTRADLLPIMPPRAVPDDPVVIAVGRVPLRLSDVRAQAGTPEASLRDLRADGTVTTAADQLALALLAERAGLDEALEVRAELALARRAVLAEAYLDLAMRRATTDERLRAAYEAEVAAARDAELLSVRSAVFPTREAAARARARIARGASFEVAARRAGGGARAAPPTGLVPPDRLPPDLAEPARSFAAGVVSDPFETEGGWSLLRVEARRAVRVPPFEVRRAAIEERLRREAMIEAARAAGVDRPAEAMAAEVPPPDPPPPVSEPALDVDASDPRQTPLPSSLGAASGWSATP